MWRCVTLSLALLGMSPLGVRAENPAQPEKDLVELLRSSNLLERVLARNGISQGRKSLIESLVWIVVSRKDDEKGDAAQRRNHQSPKHLAISLLGELRAEEALMVLLRNLTYRVKPFSGGTHSRALAVQYPAAQSLAKIGSPAVPRILQLLETTSDPLQHQIGVWILIRIEGRDVAKFLLSKRISKCSSSMRKANLEAAMEYFEKEHLGLVPDLGAVNAKDD